jgi:hypothetical protein
MSKRLASVSTVALVLVLSFALVAMAGEKPKEVTVTGVLVDSKCYAAGGFTANTHMDKENCGTMCARGGIPVGVLDQKSNTLYIIGGPAGAYADWIGMEARVSGKIASRAANVLMPDKIKVKENGKWVEKKVGKTMM